MVVVVAVVVWTGIGEKARLLYANNEYSEPDTPPPLRSLNRDFPFDDVFPEYSDTSALTILGGWSGGAKVLCILHHWGVQLILAYSWARPAILVVGKGRGGMFLFLLFLYFLSCSSFFPVPLFHLLYSLFYLFSPFLWETTQNDPQGLTCR